MAVNRTTATDTTTSDATTTDASVDDATTIDLTVAAPPNDPDEAVLPWPEDELCGLFDRWVYRRCPEPLTDGGRYAPQPPETLLERLASSESEMPVETSLSLGLGRGVPYGRAARLLLWARHAPDGPSCGSFRGAYYLLVEAQGSGLPPSSSIDAKGGRIGSTQRRRPHTSRPQYQVGQHQVGQHKIG